MIKIAILSRYQGEHRRGAERVVADWVKGLSQQFEVEILAGRDADSWARVRKGQYDLVIPTNGRWQALKMSWGRLIGGYAVMIVGHSGLGWDDLWNLSVARPNVFVSLTQATLDNWRMKLARVLAPGVKVVQIPNGVDLTVFTGKGVKTSFDLPQPVILSVGALVAQKRHHLAIEAVARMAAGSLLIVGAGPLKAELTDLAQVRLPGRFKIVQAEFEELPAIYRGAQLFTLPSWDREAFGVVYLEAMAAGLGVVAPADQARREIVGEAGILVEVEDAAKYAQALSLALKTDWQSKAAAQVAKFDWQQVFKRYAALIRSLVHSK